MFATPDLSKPFISGSYESEINSSSKTKGSLSRAYSELVKSAKKDGSVSSYLVRDFKSIVAKYNSTFDGYGQQDAQEFLRFALDGLSRELNWVTKKPVYKELKFKPGTSDEI